MSPSTVQARKMVLVSSLLLFAISIYRNRQAEEPAVTFRRLWATGVVALLLSLLADFAPKIAGPFALLTVLGWFVRDGEQLLSGVVGTGKAGAAAVGSQTTRRTGANTQTTTTRKGNTVTVAHQTGP